MLGLGVYVVVGLVGGTLEASCSSPGSRRAFVVRLMQQVDNHEELLAAVQGPFHHGDEGPAVGQLVQGQHLDVVVAY